MILQIQTLKWMVYYNSYNLVIRRSRYGISYARLKIANSSNYLSLQPLKNSINSQTNILTNMQLDRIKKKFHNTDYDLKSKTNLELNLKSWQDSFQNYLYPNSHITITNDISKCYYF